MAKILVLGGTSFFGSIMVNNLCESGHKVTIATRGNVNDVHGKKVDRIIVDRKDAKSLNPLFLHKSWDVIIDQICYSPDDAKRLFDVLSGHVGHYVMTSTAFVYPKIGVNLQEDEFIPEIQLMKMGDRPELSYEEGKRLSEVYIQKNAECTFSFARFPIVIGKDDPSRRLQFHVEAVKSGKKIFHPSWNSKISFISDTDAARCLQFLAENKKQGIYNFKSEDISLLELMNIISRVLGKPFQAGEKNINPTSPYSFDGEWTLDIGKIEKEGLASITKFDEYFEKIII